MDDDGPVGESRTRLARGTKPVALTGEQAPTAGAPRGGVSAAPLPAAAAGSAPVRVGVAPGAASSEAAQSIHEAVERLIEATEAEAAVAEWMQGGG